MRPYLWLAHSKPILLLLMAWGLSYAGDPGPDLALLRPVSFFRPLPSR